MAKKRQQPDIESEWTHLVLSEDIDKEALNLKITPNAQELKALAERLSVNEVKDLHAELRLKRVQGNRAINIQGSFEAHIIQTCVVSLNPVDTHTRESFEAWFADPDAAVSIKKAKQDLIIQKGQSEVPMLEEEDDPEAIIDGQINLGEVVTQFLCLSINPYPHAPDADYEHGDDQIKDVEMSDIIKNPFAALKDWKNRHGRPDEGSDNGSDNNSGDN